MSSAQEGRVKFSDNYMFVGHFVVKKTAHIFPTDMLTLDHRVSRSRASHPRISQFIKTTQSRSLNFSNLMQQACVF